MGTEIERKFLVTEACWSETGSGSRIRQGYLAVGPPVAVRIRVADGNAILNIKKATLDIVRDEFEYPIALDDAETMLEHLCEGFLIEKTRYKVDHAGKCWEVDVFEGVNAGLVVAEIELQSATETFVRPPWLGKEVSGDPRYLNSRLSRLPFSQWKA
jgi:adenylate cyclase